MKQIFFILLLACIGLNTIYAKELLTANDMTSLKIIEERLFSGTNSKAFRFEEDIRLQVLGAKTAQDSAVFIGTVERLNRLFETIQIRFVDTDPNYRLTVVQETNHEYSMHKSLQFSGYEISHVSLHLNISGLLTDQESVDYIHYHFIRNLTKVFIPRKGSSYYAGVFCSLDEYKTEFSIYDKYVLKNLYSYDLYKNLKETITKRRGYLSYLEMRYGKLLETLSILFKILLGIFVFLYFLYKESNRKQNPNLKTYLKDRIILFITLPFFFTHIYMPGAQAYSILGVLLPFLVNFAFNDILVLGILIIIFYTERTLLKKINTFIGKQIAILFSTYFVIALVASISYVIILFSINQSLKLPFWFLYHSRLLLYILSIAALRVFYNFISYRIQSFVNQKDVEIAKMKELKNQAELNALYSRINPHFLYNSLNSIASLAHIDADKCENMATGLSDLFRYSINKENSTYVSVAEELEMVNKYLEIEKIRFGDKLEYKIDANDTLMNQQIPKFLIQPLVENAVKHGISKIKDVGVISVEVQKRNTDIIISIFDNGPNFPEEPVSGYGLQNLHDKLAIIYGDDALINWQNGTDKHFKIILKNQFKNEN